MGFTVFQISVSMISDQRSNIRSKGQSNDLTKMYVAKLFCPVGSLVLGQLNLLFPRGGFLARLFCQAVDENWSRGNLHRGGLVLPSGAHSCSMLAGVKMFY